MASQQSPSSVSSLPFTRRIVSGIAGAVSSGLVASFVIGGLLSKSQGVPWFATSGLLGVFGLGAALAIGIWVAVLHSGSYQPHLRGLLDSKQRRFRTALSGPAIILAWGAVGQLGLRLLSAFPDRPAAGGVLTAASALGVLTGGAFGVERAAAFLARRVPAPSVGLAVAFALGVPMVLVPVLILTGTTSGIGSAWAIFGTFRRPELDLSSVWQLGLLAASSYLGAHGARRLSMPQNGAALILTLLSVFASLGAASALPFRDAVRLERSGGLASFALHILRTMSDTDGDGYASRFGGGDCDENSAMVHPGAVDIPENGIDEDCRGGDRRKPSEPKTEAASPSAAVELPARANVLLLTIDTLRFDLGFSGAQAREHLSPQLDAFAARSTVFERAYSLASYTSKSLGPMLIGRYPSETKRTFEHFDRFSPDVPFLQERIHDAGLTTVSIQGYWYFFFKGYGFERGWDQLDSMAAPKAVAIEGDRTSNGDEVGARTIEQLRLLSDSGKQFFLWSHWVDPHAEYVPHEEFDFGGESRERYDGEVAFVDEQVGRVLKSLESLSLDKNTIVVITSDHGEAFGEHGMIRHGFEVWEELVHVPLLVHVPGAKPRRITQRRSLIDVAPTILEALSLPIPRTGAESLRGASLLQDVLAPMESAHDERPILVDMPEGPHNRERRAFYDGPFKLITTAGRVLGLYNLSEDPGEKKDLSSDQILTQKMTDSMDEFLDRLAPIPPIR